MKPGGKVGNKQKSYYLFGDKIQIIVELQEVKRNFSFVKVLDVDTQDQRS